MRRRLVCLAAVGLAAALAGASCSTVRRPGTAGVPAAPNATPPRVFVAVGASETRGVGTENPLRESWPQGVFRALPPNYRLVNLALQRATAGVALANEVPIAESLHPALATVWLNLDDLLGAVPVSTYQANLAAVVHRLRVTGARVLVANTPPVGDLPAYLSCLDPVAHPGNCPASFPRPAPTQQQLAAAIDGYNAAIAAVVAQEGAVLVDLNRAAVAARDQGTSASLVSADGFHPDAAGAQLIAGLFAAAVGSP